MRRAAKDAITAFLNSILNRNGREIQRIDRLTALANRFGSDKGTQNFHRHYYTRVYKHVLAPFRGKPFRLLEIGLLHAQHVAWIAGNYHSKPGRASGSRAPSLEMWAAYFPQATIFGFDQNDFSAVQADRYKIFRGDAGSRTDLASLVEKTGGEFDVILDDASHESNHQQVALGALFPHLRPGGLFIIEDLYPQSTTQTLLRQFEVNGTFPSQFMTDRERIYFESSVETVTMYDSLFGGLHGRDALGIIRKCR
jgi:SAM-dependent methyltransferase